MTTNANVKPTMKVKVKDTEDRWPLVVLIPAVYFGSCVTGTIAYSFSIFYMELLTRYNEGKEKTNLVGTINQSTAMFLAPLISVCVNRYSCRTSICLGAFLTALGCLLCFFADSIVVLTICYGVLSGTGCALYNMPLHVVLGYNVTKHRQFFIALFSSFIALGMFCSTPLSLFLLDTYGLHGAYMMLSVVPLHLCIIGVLCKPSKVERDLIKQWRKQIKNEVTENETGVTIISDIVGVIHTPNTSHSETKAVCGSRTLDLPQLITDGIAGKKRSIMSPAFICFLFATSAWNSALVSLQMNLPNFMKETGHLNDYITIIMTCFSIGNFLGRLSFALLSIKEDLNGVLVYAGTMFMLALVTLGYPFYYRAGFANYVLASMCGFLTGAPNAVMASTALKVVGLENLSTAYSIEAFFCGLGVFTGPVISSVLLTIFKSIFTIFIFAGCVSLSGCCCSVAAFLLLEKTNNKWCPVSCLSRLTLCTLRK